MMLQSFTLGTECVPNKAYVKRPCVEIFDPTKIVAITARTMGRTDSYIHFIDGLKISVDMPPEKTLAVIQKQWFGIAK